MNLKAHVNRQFTLTTRPSWRSRTVRESMALPRLRRVSRTTDVSVREAFSAPGQDEAKFQVADSYIREGGSESSPETNEVYLKVCTSAGLLSGATSLPRQDGASGVWSAAALDEEDEDEDLDDDELEDDDLDDDELDEDDDEDLEDEEDFDDDEDDLDDDDVDEDDEEEEE